MLPPSLKLLPYSNNIHNHEMKDDDDELILKQEEKREGFVVFDACVLQHISRVPSEFIWPDEEKPVLGPPELHVPPVDLMGFASGEARAMGRACSQVSEACRRHGFFLVVNHGVDPGLIAQAHGLMDKFFTMKLSEKQRAQRKKGEPCGYASSFTGRFMSKLPWKETLSFPYCDPTQDDEEKGRRRRTVEEYFLNVMGEDFMEFG